MKAELIGGDRPVKIFGNGAHFLTIDEALDLMASLEGCLRTAKVQTDNLFEISGEGFVTFDNMPTNSASGQKYFGMKVGMDGRIWVCVDGISYIRFQPISKYIEEKQGVDSK